VLVRDEPDLDVFAAMRVFELAAHRTGTAPSALAARRPTEPRAGSNVTKIITRSRIASSQAGMVPGALMAPCRSKIRAIGQPTTAAR